MGRQLSTFVWRAGSCDACPSSGRAEVIDRIVATVNGQIILLSDWEDSLRFEAFTSGRPLNRFTAEERKAVLDRLIDRELLREQLHAADIQQPLPKKWRTEWRRSAKHIRKPKLSWGGGQCLTGTG